MAKTTIEWATDVWNPVTGCSKVSEGCRNCYAEGIAKRFWGNRPFTEVRCHEDRLTEPLHWRKPRRVFVNSMSDLFHPDVPELFVLRVFAVMAMAPQHTFMILTKRPERMKEILASPTVQNDVWLMTEKGLDDCAPVWPLPNVWLGVSTENQQTADERIPLLLQTPAAVRFVSVEPMLGEVYLTNIQVSSGEYENALDLEEWEDLRDSEEVRSSRMKGNTLDWVICGGESGPHARPMHPDWPRKLRDQCKEAGTPFMFKQWGEWLPNVYGDKSIPMNTDFNKTHCHFEDGTAMAKVGKKAAGRLLDGVEHNEYPEVQNG